MAWNSTEWHRNDRDEKAATARTTNPRVACLSCAMYQPPKFGGQRTRGVCRWWDARRLWWAACRHWRQTEQIDSIAESWSATWFELVDRKRNEHRQ